MSLVARGARGFSGNRTFHNAASRLWSMGRGGPSTAATKTPSSTVTLTATATASSTPTAATSTSTGGFLRAVLYGTQGPDTALPISDAERVTHSKKLARGKYVHELAVHDVKPEFMDKYEALICQHYPKIEGITEGNAIYAGGWKTLIGEQDQGTHLWEHKGYAGHDTAQRLLTASPTHRAFLRDLAPMLRARRSDICLEFAFWNTSRPRVDGGVYELRTYVVKPGSLLEWEMHWRRGLDVRRKYCEPIGAWFSQLGHLNTVHHMWIYPDLATRKKMREEAWSQPGWAETVQFTVPLIKDMKAHILEPLACSPLK